MSGINIQAWGQVGSCRSASSSKCQSGGQHRSPYHGIRRVQTTQNAGQISHEKRFEAIRPNHLWHLDFVQRHINRTTTFSLILIDDYSRYVVGHGIDDAERAELVIETFEQATTRHGRPEKIMNDKGLAFWSSKASLGSLHC